MAPAAHSRRAPETAVAAPAAAALEARGLTKHYGQIRAVEDVDLVCGAGEVHALVGENGAGKSTAAKILAGAIAPDAGTVAVAGAPLAAGDIRAAHAAGVFCAYQELALVPHWTVAENLALVGRSGARRFSLKRAAAQARETLEALDLAHLDPAAVTADLPLADRQQLEIARALAGDVRLLILDEASSALTPVGVRWLFARIRELTSRGGAVVYVSHRLAELAEIADRGTVLRDGRVVGHFERGGWTEDELVTQMAGRPADRVYPRPAPPRPTAVLEVEGLTSSGLHDVSLRVAEGEVLGVGGLQGHGQAELLRALYGAAPASARRWEIAGQPVGRLTPVKAVRAGLGFVPEDRKRQGLALDNPVGENLLAPWLRAAGPGGAPLLRRERPWLDRVLSALSVKTTGPRQPVGALSGGNQQKVVFGRWLDRERRVMLLHDPTRGIDVRAKHELYNAVVRLAAAGVGVIWFSTEVEELVHTCHRVLVLYRGTVADELEGQRLTADAVVGAAVGRTAS